MPCSSWNNILCSLNLFLCVTPPIGRYMNFMFDLEDASNDGTIDAREFAEVCSCYGTDKKECEQAFAKMSKVSQLFSPFPRSLLHFTSSVDITLHK